MRKYLALVVLLFVVFSNAVTADDTAKPDPRLKQKVTVDCVNGRLYSALDRISAKTKVTIHAGKNANDWQVRDMPVLVCARDIPLGKLLQGISDATHLLLSDNPVKNVSAYRIWRDAKREKEISDFEESRKAAAKAAASHDWDLLSKVKDLPEEAFSTSDPYAARDRQSQRNMSNIVSRLGLDARDRMLDGEPIVLGMSNSPTGIKPYVMACIQNLYDRDDEDRRHDGTPARQPLEDILSTCYITIQFDRGAKYPSMLYTSINIEGLTSSSFSRSVQSWLAKYMPDLPPRPTVPDIKLKRDDIDLRYKKLVLEEGRSAFLDAKIKLGPPKEGQRLTYSDLLCAASKATGYSIIAEGMAARYVSFVMSTDDQLKAMLSGKEITVRDVLAFSADMYEEMWYLDETNKLIVGRDYEWMETVKSLVPETRLKEVSAKLNGKGLALDDLLPMATLTEAQFGAWIYYCPEYPDIESSCRSFSTVAREFSLWMLYAALDPTDRATARSGKPVDLSGLDRAWTCRTMRKYLSRDAGFRYRNGLILKWTPTMDPATFTNTDSAPALSLWIETERLPDYPSKDFYTVHVKTETAEKSEEVKEYRIGPMPIFPPGKDPMLDKPKPKGNG